MLHMRLRPLLRRNATLSDSNLNPDSKNEEDEIEESSEDIFSVFLPQLFPDDTPQFHGDPGQHLLYSSSRYGDLEIMVPSYPDTPSQSEGTAEQTNGDSHIAESDAGRKLFAHILWSAALVVAEGVELADDPTSEGTETREIWGVNGESVLELGAGAALPSIVCALAGASSVAATDHPSSPALSGAITHNINHNLAPRALAETVSMQPHQWGVLDDAFSTQNKGAYTRIIAADCFWMAAEHVNLTRTMQWFLAPGGKVWIVAGFHTGRAIVANFFETAVENGFVVERIYERDLVDRLEDGAEIRRDWVPVREGEGLDNRRRWCVVAVLKRKGD